MQDYVCWTHCVNQNWWRHFRHNWSTYFFVKVFIWDMCFAIFLYCLAMSWAWFFLSSLLFIVLLLEVLSTLYHLQLLVIHILEQIPWALQSYSTCSLQIFSFTLRVFMVFNFSWTYWTSWVFGACQSWLVLSYGPQWMPTYQFWH